MKILILLYSAYTNKYGINDSYFNGFDKNSYIFGENSNISLKVREFLKNKDLLKRKINLYYGLREEGSKLEDLAKEIQKINTRAVIMGKIETTE